MKGKNMGRAISRRDFLKVASAGAAAAGFGPAFLFPDSAAAKQKTLKICQSSHSIPSFDAWFNNIFCKQWGQRHNTTVIVDNIDVSDLATTAASEVQHRNGHDLFMFLSPPPAYEKQTIDMTRVYREVEKKHGKKIDLADKSTYNPKTKRYFAFAASYTPALGHWHKDWWTRAGYPEGPDTWDDLRIGAKNIRDVTGHPCGIGLSQERYTNIAMHALLWSFGGAGQNEDGDIILNSRETIEALKYMKSLYQESETQQELRWTADSSKQSMLVGRSSYVVNDISITRQAEREHLPIGGKIMLGQPLKGPAGRYATPVAMDCYVIWQFAANKQGAQQFLIDYIDAFHEGFAAGQFCNFPCFPNTCPNLKQEISNDPTANPADKYKVLANAADWTRNIGYPGYATAAIDEVFNGFLIPTMFIKVARNEMTAEESAADAAKEMKRIFDRWKTV